MFHCLTSDLYERGISPFQSHARLSSNFNNLMTKFAERSISFFQAFHRNFPFIPIVFELGHSLPKLKNSQNPAFIRNRALPQFLFIFIFTLAFWIANNPLLLINERQVPQNLSKSPCRGNDVLGLIVILFPN